MTSPRPATEDENTPCWCSSPSVTGNRRLLVPLAMSSKARRPRLQQLIVVGPVDRLSDAAISVVVLDSFDRKQSPFDQHGPSSADPNP